MDAGPEQMKRLELSDNDPITSGTESSVYKNGVRFQLVLQRRSIPGLEGAPQTYSLLSGWIIDEQAMADTLGCWEAARRAVHLTASVTTPACPKFTFSKVISASCGILDSLKRTAPSLEEVVAPYLVDGHLHLSGTIDNVQ